MGKYISIIILFVILISGCSAPATNQSTQLEAHEGQLSIDSKDLAGQRVVRLDGEWAFYWQQLLSNYEIEELNQIQNPQYIMVPSDWTNFTNENKGFATYYLKVSIPEKQIGEAMGFYIPYQYSSYTFWIDGERIASNGYVGVSKETSRPAFQKELVYFTPTTSEIEITMNIANFEHPVGGANRQVFFGTATAISDFYTDSVASTLFVSGGILMMGIYQISIFVYRKKERAFLYFGVLSVLIALRSLFIEPIYIAELFPNFQWVWQHRIEHFIMYIAFSLYLLFLRHLYPREMRMWVLQPSIGVAVALTLITCFTQPIFYKVIFDWFMLFGAIIMMYTLFVLIQAVRNKRPTAVLNISAGIVFFSTIVYDALITVDVVRGTGVATYGFFLYVLIQSINLSRFVAMKFNESENLASELTDLNRTLDEKIDHRTRELQEMNGKLKALTLLDGLTGVNNRRFFDEKIIEIVEQVKLTQQPMTLLFIDLDEFKKYNDEYGHVEGDELIKYAATIFKEVIGEQGYVARYGGEEFVAMIPNCDEEKGRAYAKLICLRMVEAKFEHSKSSVHEFATVSVGGTSSSHHPHSVPKDWIERADQALYKSKMNGKHQVTML